jgi:putative transcriptional regulator
MSNHHPGDDLLLDLAAGRLADGPYLVVSVHVEGCPACQSRLQALHVLGGELLSTVEPQALAADALDATLHRIASRPPDPPLMQAESTRPALPEGVRWPASMRACHVSRWKPLAPGMRWSKVQLKHSFEGSLYMLRIAPGRSLARHTHSSIEMTQVLCGEFDDGRSTFAAGDFDAADKSVHHEPKVLVGSECVCLAYVGTELKFDGWFASALGRLIGM